ncbi:dATP/dGTP pyrophosphohydrolase domain-containing protein [Kordiimonas lipolytica]|uniref:dATP/dGTP pyrophosphohydrolase domain-containing protein n=1 Tax=Kordiimonas lipolytica TaxID=1662421 RepID=A0ABV8UAV1_9PROT|nr:dATP/dGTP pyrophosphohydrolase domain-containing protein [Kordiimonas lipolytica]
MASETQQSITKWAEETFGPVSDQTVLVRRAKVELDELLEATAQGDKREIGKETADIAILLYRLMELNGLNLTEEVTAKMAENRARSWLASGDGTGSHIKPQGT